MSEVNLNTTIAKPRMLRKILIGGCIAFGLVLVAGTVFRIHAREQLHNQTVSASVRNVTVIRPVGGSAREKLVLPGRLQAWYQAPVYARTNGYLRRWYVDIGQSVKTGQLLAEIDTPDVDQQLAAARAALATANAQLDLARTTATRWDRLVAQNAVSVQEADERRGDFAAREAMRNQEAANVERFETLAGFKRIVAPFDGVVTSRATDVGSLIIAGTSTTQPLFTVSDIKRLRIYVSVPQAYVAGIRDGIKGHFTVPDHPGQTFEARLVHAANSVDPESGAMLVQLVYDNSAGLLKSGAYAQVTFDLGNDAQSASAGVRIPVSSLLFRSEGPAVAVVDSHGQVSIRTVTVITDFGSELEVSGIDSKDTIIDNPADDIRPGDSVQSAPSRGSGNA